MPEEGQFTQNLNQHPAVPPPADSGSPVKYILLGIIGLTLLGGSAYAGYWYGTESSKSKVKIPKPTPVVSQPTPTPTSVPSVEDETKDWKTYTNTRFGYAIKYPPIPETHIVETEDSLTLYLSTQAPQLTLVIKAEESTNLSLEEVIEKTINRSCCNVTKEELNFKGVPAMRGVHVISGPETMNAYFEYLAFVKDQNEYMVTVDSGVKELSEQHRTLIDQILSTFKFLD